MQRLTLRLYLLMKECPEIRSYQFVLPHQSDQTRCLDNMEYHDNELKV